MIVWLASYPRSGNTFFRILLHRLFGFQTHSVYSVPYPVQSIPDDTRTLMRLVGQTEMKCDLDLLHADPATHFVKTHNLPAGDADPAIVIVRDGREAAVSYTHFLLKTQQGIERPPKDLFEATLEQIITGGIGDGFGGWSRNVNAWIDRAGWDSVIRYEDLIKDPINIAASALRRLGVGGRIGGAAHPSMQELHAAVPWFFRKGQSGYWRQEMPSHLQEIFLERHGDTLLRLGYSEQSPPD
jgi:hypothetical protein